MSVLVERCLKRSRLVDELIESYEVEVQKAAGDAEELCSEALELCRLCGHAWKSLAQGLLTGRMLDIEQNGRDFQTAIKQSVEAVSRSLKLVALAQSTACPISGLEALKKGLDEIKDIESRIERSWPFIDRDMVMESRAAYERGEFETTEELLNRLASRVAEDD